MTSPTLLGITSQSFGERNPGNGAIIAVATHPIMLELGIYYFNPLSDPPHELHDEHGHKLAGLSRDYRWFYADTFVDKAVAIATLRNNQ